MTTGTGLFASAWRLTGEALGELVHPWRCALCAAAPPELRSPFCEPCRAELLGLAARNRAMSCPRCALPAGPFANLEGGCSECRGKPLGFDAAVALGPYEEPWRGLCLKLKHDRGAWLAPWLGALLVEARGADLALTAPPPAGAWVAPVPQHWLRRLQRGYNQAEALARAVARPLRLPTRRALRRVKPTHHLVGLGPRDRAEAIRGAFVARRGTSLRGETVLLIDDVLTTGATLGEAARVLKRAGARRVVAVVLTRTL